MEINVQATVDAILCLLPEWGQQMVLSAYAYADDKHQGQLRPGGESQIMHATRVAFRVIGLTSPEKTTEYYSAVEEVAVVVAAFLHDIIEDTDATYEEVSDLFGEGVAMIVRAVSHVEEEESDEVYLSRVARGGRLAVLVKLSDRLDNLDTLRYAPQDFRERKLAEIRAALPIWYRIDPNGAPLIEELLEEVEND